MRDNSHDLFLEYMKLSLGSGSSATGIEASAAAFAAHVLVISEVSTADGTSDPRDGAAVLLAEAFDDPDVRSFARTMAAGIRLARERHARDGGVS